VSTLHVGTFRAREVILRCRQCGGTHRPKELAELVPSGANFGFDVLVYAGKALFLRHRNEEEVVAELAERNISISPREISVLGQRFIVYLAIAHDRSTESIKHTMHLRGGYVCHLDATCEGRDPLLMSSLDSLSEIVLGSIKLPSEAREHIIPFLERIKQNFGIPLALVHDMGAGILRAVEKVFPNVPDFICHFHFLRDLGKDLLEDQYDLIRKRLRKHRISPKLRQRAKLLKREIEQNPETAQVLQTDLEDLMQSITPRQWLPWINSYGLIHWALAGKTEGHGYGFPFDRPHLAFAKRLRKLYSHLDKLKEIQLRGESKDNRPYFKILTDLRPVMRDQTLWKAVDEIDTRIAVFERLRKAMRIAPQSGRQGINDEPEKTSVRTIEHRVNKFCAYLTRRKGYQQDQDAQKVIAQINKYWTKLFADPIEVQTPSGTIQIQPQRTNNILEQFFRYLKRGNRRKTGTRSSGRMLRTMLAETPLVRNLENPDYMKILLGGKATLEEVFAEIEVVTLREELRKARLNPERVPIKIRRLIALPNYPEELLSMLERAVA
jgi:hypothetical protein